jgi:hypothetical protein
MARSMMILLNQKLVKAKRIYGEQNKIAMNIIPCPRPLLDLFSGQ